jgi:2-dehydro-3-deoxygluconokinase
MTHDRPARTPRLVALGETMLRLSTDSPLDRSGSLDVHVAGSESNVAVALAQLGWETAWFSALPSTPLGRRVADELRGAGVDVSAVRWADDPDARMGLFFVEHAPPPRRTSVWYDRAGSAASKLGPGDLDPDLLEGAAYALVSGITTGLGAGPRALALRFVDEARARGAKVCVDVNYRAKLWSADEAAPVIAELVADADVVVCGAHDADVVWGIGGDRRDAVVHLRRTRAPAAELVVLTTGSDGAVASLADGTVVEQPAYPTTVVDRVGAGDAFVAGLLWGLEEHGGSEALRAGALAAALKCTMRGDLLLITEDEFREHFSGGRTRMVDR